MKYLSRELNESDKVYYHQLKKSFKRATLLAIKIQEAIKEIANPYIIALQNHFPNENIDNLIQIADTDLTKNNKTYQGLTKILQNLKDSAKKAENAYISN